MRDPRHPRHFTDEFKRQIVDLYNAGKPKREIMDEYDLGKSTVERWIKSINATGSPRAACMCLVKPRFRKRALLSFGFRHESFSGSGAGTPLYS